MSVLIQRLLDPRRYPHPVAQVRLIETHISWLLLTGTYAYKVKKPVSLPFVDFASLGSRRHYCTEELRLNRRYAPEVYLDVVAITGSAEQPSIDGTGEAIEYAVRMREFAQEDLMDRRLAARRLTHHDVDALADTCARLHAGAAIAPEPYGDPDSVLAPAAANFETVRGLLEAGDALPALAAIEHWTRLEFDRRKQSFAQRKRSGRIRDCHGDLHLGNIVLIGGAPTPFDCIEFDPRLRWIDVMNEIAFTVMDFHARGRGDLGQRLLNRYLEASGDYEGVAVLAFYEVYRALVRAKIEAIRARQADLSSAERERQWQAFSQHLALAQRFARPQRPFLAITCGLSGSGKTHVSQALLERTLALRVRSDVERKRLCGLAPHARSGSELGGGIYTAELNDRTFERLAALARTIVAAGYPVIIDASFLRRGRRNDFRRLAAALGVPFAIVHCGASETVMVERILRRQAEGSDASEATLAVLHNQRQRAQPLDESERDCAVTVDSADPDSIETMVAHLASMGE